MRWVAGAIGDKDTIKVMGHFVNWIVERENSDTSSPVDKTSENVFFDTTVDHSNVTAAITRADVERSLGTDFAYKVDLFRIHKGLILIGIVFLTDGEPGKGRSLFS